MKGLFYAIVRGKGEGCGYTIGCNVKCEKLNSNTEEGAVDEVFKRWRDNIGSEFDIESIELLRVEEVIDCAKKLDDARRELKEEERARERSKKEADFARLKKELGR